MSNPTLPARSTVEMTIHISKDRLEAFHLLFDEFTRGPTRHDAAVTRQRDEYEEGKASLAALFKFATTHHTGGSEVVANVLASLYNGNRFKVDLTDLRLLDGELFGHVLNVLKLDHRPRQDVHCYFNDGGRRFEEMFDRYELMNYVTGQREGTEQSSGDD
jgi:hypothetical protein